MAAHLVVGCDLARHNANIERVKVKVHRHDKCTDTTQAVRVEQWFTVVQSHVVNDECPAALLGEDTGEDSATCTNGIADRTDFVHVAATVHHDCVAGEQHKVVWVAWHVGEHRMAEHRFGGPERAWSNRRALGEVSGDMIALFLCWSPGDVVAELERLPIRFAKKKIVSASE